MTFVDTSFCFALFFDRRTHHARARTVGASSPRGAVLRRRADREYSFVDAHQFRSHEPTPDQHGARVRRRFLRCRFVEVRP